MRGFFLKNINIDGKGGVVASPDHNTPGGSYYYHWERDGALSMRALLQISNFSSVNKLLDLYTKWVLNVQVESDPHGIDVRTEPKYELPDGKVFDGSWCRPQNDGPALRGTTLMMYAEALHKAGQSDYVKQYLWTGDSSKYNGGAIKYDLDWVANGGYKESTCDLWEEIQSTDFFWNHYSFRKAMLMGSEFATSMGDKDSAARYMQAASITNKTAAAHWNGAFVFESNSRPKDSAVIVAFNDGFCPKNPMFSPVSSEVASTVKTLTDLFCQSYPINKKDYQSQIGGVLYGRYQGDHYAGGNPWILLTAALGQLYYNGAKMLLEEDMMPSANAFQIWSELFGLQPDLQLSPLELAEVFASAGDGVLERIRYHVSADGFHLAEQFDKDSGTQLSAKDLTWSYAETLMAMKARESYVFAKTKYTK